METPDQINPARFTNHSAIHAARQYTTCVQHVRSRMC